MNRLDDLIRALLSGNEAESNRAVKRVGELATTGDNTGVLALEEVIKRKANNSHCRFYVPKVRAFLPGEGDVALEEIRTLASQKRLLENPGHTQSLLSAIQHSPLLMMTTPPGEHPLQQLMMEIATKVGQDQGMALMLLATHTRAVAILTKRARERRLKYKHVWPFAGLLLVVALGFAAFAWFWLHN